MAVGNRFSLFKILHNRNIVKCDGDACMWSKCNSHQQKDEMKPDLRCAHRNCAAVICLHSLASLENCQRVHIWLLCCHTITPCPYINISLWSQHFENLNICNINAHAHTSRMLSPCSDVWHKEHRQETIPWGDETCMGQVENEWLLIHDRIKNKTKTVIIAQRRHTHDNFCDCFWRYSLILRVYGRNQISAKNAKSFFSMRTLTQDVYT